MLGQSFLRFGNPPGGAIFARIFLRKPHSKYSILLMVDMNTQDIRTLKILEAIESSESPSQRDMAQALNVSLGLINSFIRRMAKKGYFKISHLPRNRIRYILTPKGAAEKTRLTYTYIQLSLQFYKDARQKFRQCLKDLECQGVRNVAFFGAGDMAEIGCLSIKETNLKLVAIADSQRFGEVLLDMPIIEPDALNRFEVDRIIITATDQSPTEAAASLREGNILETAILVL
jgi:DNA-binding MarR family transcriptional regulator